MNQSVVIKVTDSSDGKLFSPENISNEVIVDIDDRSGVV